MLPHEFLRSIGRDPMDWERLQVAAQPIVPPTAFLKRIERIAMRPAILTDPNAQGPLPPPLMKISEIISGSLLLYLPPCPKKALQEVKRRLTVPRVSLRDPMFGPDDGLVDLCDFLAGFPPTTDDSWVPSIIDETAEVPILSPTILNPRRPTPRFPSIQNAIRAARLQVQLESSIANSLRRVRSSGYTISDVTRPGQSLSSLISTPTIESMTIDTKRLELLSLSCFSSYINLTFSIGFSEPPPRRSVWERLRDDDLGLDPV